MSAEVGQASAKERVVLVDEAGRPVGTCEKLRAHEAPGARHLAFSVFLYSGDGTTLLQRRAASKYHFPLLWTNACCSHPRPGEALEDAAVRRVHEELGLWCEPRPAGSFVYRAADPASGLVEHELDHVFYAELSGAPSPDSAEVAEVALVAPEALLSGSAGLEITPWCLAALRLAERARSAK